MTWGLNYEIFAHNWRMPIDHKAAREVIFHKHTIAFAEKGYTQVIWRNKTNAIVVEVFHKDLKPSVSGQNAIGGVIKEKGIAIDASLKL